MKIIQLAVIGLANLVSPALAETIVCSYPPYTQGGSQAKNPIVIEIRVSGETAVVRSQVPPTDFRVFQNTKVGLVLAHSFAVQDQPNKAASIGAFVLLVDRTNASFVRGNVIAGESWSTYAEGTCIFQQ